MLGCWLASSRTTDEINRALNEVSTHQPPLPGCLPADGIIRGNVSWGPGDQLDLIDYMV